MTDSRLPNRPLRPLIVFGTRPEAIKLCPVILECQKRPESIDAIVCSTGQHREMLAQVLGYFGITPDIDLGLMKPGQTLTGLTAACLQAVDGVIVDQKPDCVVVQGDTTTVMAAAMAAFYHRIPIVHVEAGLRTGDLTAPWPEEFNRRVAGIITELHCAPTNRSAEALRREGVPEANIRVTGNTVIDALLHTVEKERSDDAKWRQQYPAATADSVVLVTGHRRENFGPGLASILDAVAELARLHPETQFIYPVHLNPNVKGPVHERLAGLENVHLVPPADYPQFVWLMDRASVVLTDSGGVQEEAPSLGNAVLVTRDKTERPEAVDAGLAELVGTNRELIVRRVSESLAAVDGQSRDGKKSRVVENPYGDGKSSSRIVDWMLERWPGQQG
ncbi:non-hydrolyzing UDP-N-acetylglucosamine 2-epimerase [Rubripirellula reticaptiva]|uniref:UDP-N-acetylglucosamine 2-epimerase (non-hydrolyzing) n=1 Tax=Rubripirellula reticaptiva TaxID=2528013 RepID=A0A5C6F158_9BACT|nr:UDP-N-acetylglucosamine 2-epimerase (non-hydrolyzing) [Rubripirellula reticaptiva]TWU55088.1 UDP-N-acetylglucosamine 2-epimerase [Rubripirellula reticaptiva]